MMDRLCEVWTKKLSGEWEPLERTPGTLNVLVLPADMERLIAFLRQFYIRFFIEWGN